MRTLSANDVQKGLGGILAYIGFQALVWTAFLIASPAKTDWGTILFTVYPSIGLLIGIRMFMGKPQAVSWALQFLALYLILGVGVVLVTWFTSSLAAQMRSYVFFSGSVQFVAPAVLFCLLLWCRTKWVPDETEAEQLDGANSQ